MTSKLIINLKGVLVYFSTHSVVKNRLLLYEFKLQPGRNIAGTLGEK